MNTTCPTNMSLSIVFPSQEFPSLASYLAVRGEGLLKSLSVGEVASVLFRGFEVSEPLDLEGAASALRLPVLPDLGNDSPRTLVSGKVYTSTEFPGRLPIRLHQENSYTAQPPGLLLFNCVVPADLGGGTPLSCARAALTLLEPSTRARLETSRLCYIQNLHGGLGLGRSWQDIYGTTSEAEVEVYLRNHDVDFEWKTNELDDSRSLFTREVRWGIRRHKGSGARVLFTQAHLWHPSSLDPETRSSLQELYTSELEFPKTVVWEDLTPVSDADIAAIHKAWEDASFVFAWKKGDVLLVENVLAAHGREAFSGNRKVHVVQLGSAALEE